MRNILIAVAVLALTTVAISQTTSHLDPNVPPHRTVKWAPGMNNNMYIPDTLLGGGGALSLTSPNGVQFADQFAGATADVKLNACVTAAISSSSGICDARGLGGAQTIVAQVNVGNTAQQPVTLLLPSSGTWLVTITDGTSCAIKHFSNAALIGFNGGLGQLVIEPNNSSTNLRALYCTDLTPAGNGSYIRAEGFQLYNPVGATLTQAAMDLEHSFGPAYVHGRLLRGTAADAVIGVSETESAAMVDGILTLGILWLDHCRQHSDTRRHFGGLKVIVPIGAWRTTAERMAWMNHAAADFQLFTLDERSEELEPVD